MKKIIADRQLKANRFMTSDILVKIPLFADCVPAWERSQLTKLIVFRGLSVNPTSHSDVVGRFSHFTRHPTSPVQRHSRVTPLRTLVRRVNFFGRAGDNIAAGESFGSAEDSARVIRSLPPVAASRCVPRCVPTIDPDRDGVRLHETSSLPGEGRKVTRSGRRNPLGLRLHETDRDGVSLSETSGEAGIRTLGRISPTSVFETDPIGHSGTSPNSSGSHSRGPTTRRKGGFPAIPDSASSRQPEHMCVKKCPGRFYTTRAPVDAAAGGPVAVLLYGIVPRSREVELGGIEPPTS